MCVRPHAMALPMNEVTTDHINLRLTDAVMAAFKAKKGEAETRRRVASAIHAEAQKLVLIGVDQAIIALANRRSEIVGDKAQ